MKRKAIHMSDSSQVKTDKILENSFLGNLMIPIAIVLVAALIIFGVTKMVSTERSYKDLVREMNSKTFGNKWIAAYELSKQITASQIPQDEMPWLITNLREVFESAKDLRTKEFIVVAMGALRNPDTSEFLLNSLKEKDGKINFHALVALGNIKPPLILDWAPVEAFLGSKDKGLQQTAMLALATHKVVSAQAKIRPFLKHDEQTLRYSAALGLLNFQDEEALPVLKEILLIKTLGENRQIEGPLNGNDVLGLKLNILDLVRKSGWTKLNSTFQKMIDQKDNKKVSLRAEEVLKLLKN